MRRWGIILGAALALIAPAQAAANGTISGSVTLDSGPPAPNNYEVQLYAVGGLTPLFSTCSASDGSGFWTLFVPAGTYEVFFAGGSGPGCTPDTAHASEWWNNHGPRKFADTVTVTDGGVLNGISASLQDGAEVRGTVSDLGTGARVANVTVDLIDADGTLAGTACTAADGTYAIKRLSGGAFQARFTPNGICGSAGNYQTLFYNQSTTQAGATSVNVGNAEIVMNIDARLSPPPVTLTVQKSGNGTGNVLSVPAGIDCGATCAASFAVGSPVGLSASPTGGSSFTGWSGGGCSGTGACNVTMDAAKTVTATFAAGGGGGGGGGGGDEDRPDTKIDSSKIKAKKGKATFTFSGSGGAAPLTFECLLAGKSGSPGYHECSSPVTYKKLRKGRYTFFVQARGADGLGDRSPADTVFKSKLKKKRHH